MTKLYSDAVHGVDNRKDIFELDPDIPGHELVRRAASGVGMLVTHDKLYYGQSNQPRLHTEREAGKTCTGESPFYRQPKYTGMAATAFLVNERHVVTAGHAVDTLIADELCVVFGYVARANWKDEITEESPPYELEPSQLARIDRILYCSTSAATGDLAVLHLADAVDPATAVPLEIARRHSIRNGPGYSMIGYPRGLPCKAVVGGRDIDTWPRVWSFDARSVQTNADVFQKCSGSPLLDRSGRVVAVMSNLPEPHEPDLGCFPVLPETPGTAWCSRIDLIADLMGELGIRGV